MFTNYVGRNTVKKMEQRCSRPTVQAELDNFNFALQLGTHPKLARTVREKHGSVLGILHFSLCLR